MECKNHQESSKFRNCFIQNENYKLDIVNKDLFYRKDIDALKGIAIIAVVLFHIGLLKSGYLGVDAFFVINGFLVIPSVVKKIATEEFSFFYFMKRRLIRLLPLIVIASAISLILGYFLMLPDHYENLAQSVIASCAMSENILSAITTKNYWNVSNEYSPLMHLWYVGILFEFYIVMPLLLMVTNKFALYFKKNNQKWMEAILIFFTVFSLTLYFLPSVTIGDRFYYLSYRFFELGFGGLVALRLNSISSWIQRFHLNKLSIWLFVAILFCSFYNILTEGIANTHPVIGGSNNYGNGIPFSPEFALISTVLLTTMVIAFSEGEILLKSNLLAWIGKMSYSIFIWHQVLLAFYRYSISDEMNLMFILCFLLVILLISNFCYRWIEKKIVVSKRSLLLWCLLAIAVTVPSGYLYLHAGVVRDVPELDIVKGNEYRGMHAEYCDRVYSYRKFPDSPNGKINVFVEGVSFGRDFANIILESSYADSINLCYAYKWEDDGVEDNLLNADYIFTFRSKNQIPSRLLSMLNNDQKIMGISTKNYGSCLGNIYINRFRPDYYNQTSQIETGYIELSNEWKRQWGDDYIDLLTPSLAGDNNVRVFTDDHRFISQDGSHLTQAGAQWYAKILDWNLIFDK